MTENTQLRSTAIFVGYLAWFAVLVRVLFLSTGNPYTDTAEILGSHVGLAFWLLVLSLIPYLMARARAKKSGGTISWPYVMTGVTLIALALSAGGFYAHLHTASNAPATAEAGPWTEYQKLNGLPQGEQNIPPPPPGFVLDKPLGSAQGRWSCNQSNQSFGLFLFPDSKVYMSAEPNKWALMDQLHWSASDSSPSQAGDYLIIQMQSQDKALVRFPAGEMAECTR